MQTPGNPVCRTSPSTRVFSSRTDDDCKESDLNLGTIEDDLEELLPFQESSHRSTKISVPEQTDDAVFDRETFHGRLIATIDACQQLGKSSIWLEVPMNRCSLIEHGHLQQLGFQFHHALEHVVVLNKWLHTDVESKVPNYATHNVGVGALVVNSRNEILLVREKRRNHMKWKTPTGLSDLGEELGAAAVREVLEETGIYTTFHSVLGFRQTHGLAHGISDLFFVCRLDPVEDTDEQGKLVIPQPIPEASEIETTEWVPLSEYRELISDKENGHPMMRHVLERYDDAKYMEKSVVRSVVPGRKPNAIYLPK